MSRWSTPGEAYAYETGYIEGMADAKRWIPCSERLPEEYGDYWVTIDPDYVPPGYRTVDVITWRNGKWLMADYFVLDGDGRKKPDYKVVDFLLPIIAWMPLPDPYKKGDEG